MDAAAGMLAGAVLFKHGAKKGQKMKTGEVLKELGIKVKKFITIYGEISDHNGLEISPEIVGVNKSAIVASVSSSITGKKILNGFLILVMILCAGSGIYSLV